MFEKLCENPGNLRCPDMSVSSIEAHNERTEPNYPLVAHMDVLFLQK